MIKRAATAAVAAPAVLYIIRYFPIPAFFIFLLLVTGLALMEYYNMVLPPRDVWGRGIGLILGCAVLSSVFLDSSSCTLQTVRPYYVSTGCCSLSIAVVFFYYMRNENVIRDAYNKIAVHFLGIFFIALLFSYILLLRALPGGTKLLLLLVLVTWAGDTAAYITGTFAGKHALCPRISPKKTIEGSAGSLAAGTAAACAIGLLYEEQMSLTNCLLIGVGINLLNQFGELTESLIKRTFGVKDSGYIFPGHGGILDRIDSLLFAAPFLFYYVTLLMPLL